ncbi:ABC transporter permease [Paenibacillus alkalitolerans]|uniref:ABC transporter permease n=1 Tax=Paenibacillus alkalitolerans TaxID=2799335 RepID=UPI0018F4CF89|nr:ABC transporter permease subunit [Paenibacillus alkalitolerans]
MGKTKAATVSFRGRLAKDFLLNKHLYIMMVPVIVFYVIFHYFPMYGAIIAFKDFSPIKGVMGSSWVGFEHFESFFSTYYFWRLLKNTLLLSLYSLIFEFPAPIILAIMINEVRNKQYKKSVQLITYMPHFISMIVIAGIIKDFTSSNGIITYLWTFFGGDGTAMLQHPDLFRPIYIISGIWQSVGWESIIYLAALMGIDQEQYEAARMDGAGRFKQIWHITLPGLLPTIMILLILRIGNMMNVGWEKIILLYNPTIYETADVISSFVYRKGLLEFGWSYSSAVGLFNSVINLILLVAANWISRKVNEHSLW